MWWNFSMMALATPALATWVLLAIGIPLLVAGIRLARRGLWSRRVGQTLHCRKCDYILSGLIDAEGMKAGGDSKRCPECGTPASGKNLVMGDLPRRTARGWAGLLFMLLGLGLVGIVVSGKLLSVDWYHHKPVGWVLDDARSSNSARSRPAWAEIHRRRVVREFEEDPGVRLDDAAGDALIGGDVTDSYFIAYLHERYSKMSDVTRRKIAKTWVDKLLGTSKRDAGYAAMELETYLTDVVGPEDAARLTKAAFDAQPRSQRGQPRDYLIRYLARRAETGKLNPAELARFFEQGLTASFEVREKAAVGEQAAFTLNAVHRDYLNNDWETLVAVERLELDGQAVSAPRETRKVSTWGGGEPTASGVIDIETPGHHVLRATLKISNSTRDRTEVPGKLVHQHVMIVTREFEVPPPGGVGSVRRVADDAMKARIERCVKAGWYPVEANERASAYLEIDRPPVDVAFGIYLRIKGVEKRVGEIVARSGKVVVVPLEEVDADFKSLDLILRSDPKPAWKTMDVFEIWQGELHFPELLIHAKGQNVGADFISVGSMTNAASFRR